MTGYSGRILAVDDDASQRKLVRKRFGNRYEILLANDCESALKVLNGASVDLLLLDLFLPDGSGWKVAQVARKLDPDLAIVVMSGRRNFDNALRAIRYGALDFFTKNWRDKKAVRQFEDAIERGVRDAVVRRQASASVARIERRQRQAEELVSFSNPMKAVEEKIDEAARSDLPVLIEGETGSGKEVVAKSIHNSSRFSSGPFVAVHIAGLNRETIDSELFGHVRGAFTGATRDHAGYFEAANHGTLLLDEASEIPPPVQVKLLRGIESREISRVGSTRNYRFDLRIIAATNQQLSELVDKNEFRQDLYYRLKGIQISVPPLRERVEDIPHLARHFLISCVRESRRDGPLDFEPGAIDLLCRQEWPGNVRELRTVVERLVFICDAPIVSAEIIRLSAGLGIDSVPPSKLKGSSQPLKEILRMCEEHYVTEALAASGGNISKAARSSGESFATFYSRMKRLGIGR